MIETGEDNLVKVVHIIQATPFGGAQKCAAQMADHERRLGVDAHLIVLYYHESFLNQLKERNLAYVCLGKGPFDPAGWTGLLKGVNQLEPDIIQLHFALLWVLGVLVLGTGKRCPWIYLAQSYPPNIPTVKHRLVRYMLRQHVDAVIGVSESVTQAQQGYFGGAIKTYRTIYNAVEPADIWNLREDRANQEAGSCAGRPTIGMALRFAPDTGVREFIEAIPTLSRYLPEARFVLAGEGPLLPWARHQAAALGLNGILEFPGFIPDMPRFWASLDFALFTGPQEPFGLRIIEPQAAGTVVVGYRNGSGSDEIIIPGETGILVPWGDHESLARECAGLWANPTRYSLMAMAAQKRLIKHFSQKKITQHYIDLYYEIINNNRHI